MKMRPFILLIALIFSACQGAADNPSGQIIFESHRYINFPDFHIVDIHNLKVTSLPIGTELINELTFSPDGEHIVYISEPTLSSDIGGKIYNMRVDGTDHRLLFNTSYAARNPVFSPDGSKIAFSNLTPRNSDIFIMESDGSNPINLTNHPSLNAHPAWSPDGTKIVFSSAREDSRATDTEWIDDADSLIFDIITSAVDKLNYEIFLMNTDGTNQINLSENQSLDIQPSWSPEGSRIIFVSDRDGNEEIYVMNIDGSGLQRITYSPGFDLFPDWRPQLSDP